MDISVYEFNDPRPTKREFKTYYIYSKGECVAHVGYDAPDTIRSAFEKLNNITPFKATIDTSDVHAFIRRVKSSFIVEESHNEPAYMQALNAYRKKQNEINEKWSRALCEFHNVDYNDKAVQNILSYALNSGTTRYDEEDTFETMLDFVDAILKVKGVQSLYL